MKSDPATTLRRFKPYPAYKPSGVEWLGEIPAHWEVKALKALSQLQTGLTLGKKYEGRRLITRPYLRVVNVQDGYLDLDDVAEVELPEQDAVRYELREGDVLMTEGGDFDKLGRGYVWESQVADCLHQNHIFAVRPRGELLSPRYLALAMKSGYGRAYFTATSKQSTNMASTNSTKLRNLPMPVPSAAEQRVIAAFLDRETARIDAPVAKKERLIELLQEKRTALITRAVTKGLDPNVPMKDSGVEWLGEIPAHWEVLAAGRLIERIEQGWSPVAEDRAAGPDEWAVIKLSAVSHGQFHADEHKALPEGLTPDTRYEIRDGDFLLTRANTPQLVGDVCVVRRTPPRLMLCDLVYRLQLSRRLVLPGFLSYWFLSTSGRHEIEVEARGSSQSMVKVSQGHIRAWTVLVPPAREQHAIVALLDRETARIDALVAKVREAIARLKELRTALISAAVTGKIDVRGEISSAA